MKRKLLAVLLFSIFLSACRNGGQSNPVQDQAQAFLNTYNENYRALTAAANEGQWILNTRIVKGDTISQSGPVWRIRLLLNSREAHKT